LDAERAALEDLLKSDGWAIYLAHVDRAWGHEACERALRDARKSVTLEEWPFESARILDTFAAMRANLRWPVERVRQIADGEAARKSSLLPDPFAKLRRTTRTA
jgi:hypothetical protein